MVEKEPANAPKRLTKAQVIVELAAGTGLDKKTVNKFFDALNGSLTIGTLDGANVEIREAVGSDWFFLFGLTTPEVEKTRREGYNPRHFYETNPELREVIDLVASGFFSFEDRALFRPLTDNLLSSDPYRVMVDFASYLECQRRVEDSWQNRDWWARASARNTAMMGRFSSDRTIREYARDIWRVDHQRVVVPAYVSTDPV